MLELHRPDDIAPDVLFVLLWPGRRNRHSHLLEHVEAVEVECGFHALPHSAAVAMHILQAATAMTIPARAPYSFFFQPRSKPDDAIAGDYVEGWDLKRPETATILRTVSPRVGKEIAHLTYGRLAYRTDKERQWAFTDITRALVGVINDWLRHAPPYVNKTLVEYIRDYTAQSELLAASRRDA